MAGDKRELILDLLARDKSGPATKSFAKNLDDAADAADKAGKSTAKLGDKAEAAGRGVDKFGDQATGAARDVAKLDREILKAEAELKLLAHQFAETDDAAKRLDLSKSIRKGENDIRRLNKSKGLLSALLPDPDPAQVSGWVGKLTGSISSSLAGVSPMALGAGIIGAALAPTIGAAVSGAVVGGIGAAGIIGGFALVAKDPAISGYAKRIGQTFSKSIQGEAKDSFLGPAKSSLMALEALATRSAPKIGKIFENSAPGVAHLTDAIAGSADALLDAAVVASGKSGPALDALGRIVQGTSESLGDFITMLADHADEGASALDDINTALQNTIKTTGYVVGGLASAKGALDDFDGAIDKGRYGLEDHVSWLDLTADGYKKGSEAAKLYRDGVIGSAGSVNDYDHYLAGAAERTNKLAEEQTNAAKAADGQRQALFNLSGELRAQTDPVFGLLKAEDDLAAAQEKARKATKEHGKTSLEAKVALRDLAEAALNLQGKAGSLSETFNGELTPELKATLRAGGLTEDQIRQLAGQFRAAKRDGESYAKNYKASVSVSGTANAKKSLYSARDAANSIPRAVSIAIRVTGNSNVSEVAAGIRKQYRAAGGPVTKDTPYWVGENGPELIFPNSDGRVLSAASSASVAKGNRAVSAATNGGGGGIAPGRLRLEFAGEDAVVTMFRRLIRSANLLQDA